MANQSLVNQGLGGNGQVDQSMNLAPHPSPHFKPDTAESRDHLSPRGNQISGSQHMGSNNHGSQSGVNSLQTLALHNQQTNTTNQGYINSSFNVFDPKNPQVITNQ